ncbi:YdeI/OmpD-associated family protein [Arcicella lustrica]|uniref:YdeI/OmpD-associated family protein n=1 Tax=Arcicella lustrica TaxID=2984196 RepID=A0ABU5SF47_9BACT|nr:YdeI/OmpD-associated family protein [Arcicella sp. DC25W]MEA5425907.1 YdeI/OmpD-associated family protein [Arcicella sp. DC25W]
MQTTAIETFSPTSRENWREWLAENHRSKQSIWLVYYKIQANIPTVSYNDAVDEALCFGWIDSTKKSLGNDTFMQFFSKRKPNSVWSKINKGKIQRLIDEGLMTEAGFESIEKAKQNGSWSILDEVEELIIPEDLENEFNTKSGSKDFFLSLSKSVRKAILQWLVLAKQAETRQRRITEIAELASQKLKPKQF